MLRQQCLITALAQQVDARTLVTRFQRIARANGRNLNTSITAKDLATWADLASRMRSAPITRLSVQMPGGSTNPDYAEIRRRVGILTATPGPTAATTDVPTSDPVSTAGVQRRVGTTAPAGGDQWLRDSAC
jgi:anionic cell wall polymer biosynthesis LytR-Cps2A-Psr (LCP) family protein